MKVSLIQSAPKLSRLNIDEVLAKIESQEGDVIVFPELALSGYLLQDKLYEDAWKLEELAPLLQASLKRDIVIGAALWDKGKVYNSAIYLSQGEITHVHRKKHLPTYGMFEEGRYFAAGDTIESFSTRYGTSVMVVCEDLWRAQTMAELASLDADIIYVLAASPARDFEENGLHIESQWDALLKSAALFSHTHVVFVNRVGFEDGLGFWGGSRVISPNGECIIQMEHFRVCEATLQLNLRLQKVGKYISKQNEGFV